MITKSNSEHQLRELSKEEIEALVAEMGPIEVPEGPLTNAGEPCVITTCTLIVEELGLNSHARRGKACAK